VQVGIHAVVVDDDTKAIADALAPVFEKLERELGGDYGGIIEHLWIDLELLEYLANADGSPRHSFRFQKRVSGRSHFGLPEAPSKFNVGHFSVRPDFALLISNPVELGVGHVLQKIYSTSAILLEKQRQLGGFDATQFRERFMTQCRQLGYPIEA
jgi:hypothetical protein